LIGKKNKPESANTSDSETAKAKDEQILGKKKKEARPAEKASLSEQLAASETKAKENYERLLRLTAEFDNYKKRSEREMNDFRKFANESLMKEILPVVDNLERALAIECKHGNDAFKGLREGVEMTLKGLIDTLQKFGIVPLDAMGKTFDPNFHQAVSQEESDEHPDSTVLKELQKGYLINDRLLRPSMVIVSKRSVETKKAGVEDSKDQISEPSEENPADNAEGSSKVRVTVH
jgi:molecular chaperone GrpE